MPFGRKASCAPARSRIILLACATGGPSRLQRFRHPDHARPDIAFPARRRASCLYPSRKTFDSGRPLASSSTSLSRMRISRIRGSSISSIRTPQITPLT